MLAVCSHISPEQMPTEELFLVMCSIHIKILKINIEVVAR